MKQNNRFCVLALTAVLALTLTACSETADGSAASGSTQTTQPAQSTAQQDTSAGTPSASQQTEVLGSLTSSELQELVSGSTTLEQLTQQRAEAADPGTGSTTALPEYEQQLQALINQLYAVKARAESSLNNTIQSATAEYKALPAAKQTKSRKIAIVMGKASDLCRNIPGTRCRGPFLPGEILFLSGSRILQLRSGFCSTPARYPLQNHRQSFTSVCKFRQSFAYSGFFSNFA